MPINKEKWGTKYQNRNIEVFVVSALKVSQKFAPDSKAKKIHWRLSGGYNTDSGSESTIFDTANVENQGPYVEIDFYTRGYIASHNATKNLEFQVLKDYTSNDVANLVRQRRLNVFRYNAQGTGCRTWTARLIEELEDEGVIPRDSVTRFRQAVEESNLPEAEIQKVQISRKTQSGSDEQKPQKRRHK
ncbi:hypothetical protein CPB84DRAFT_1742147 [Gymnopilus junonius]|uniref:DUF7770 domain-containing protein n=1 Tax=Gymnopilus junonius TaxID=109634 RepID=A0A9P5P3Q7_GYMJU|nr:hypothetical protein CPB84DRAFT_1742147 [Gymnopilus junonius]